MTTKTLQQRAEIEAAIEGRTLCDQLRVTAERSGDAPALSHAGGSGTQTITWAQAREQALRLAAGFIALGLQPGERVALMLPNRSEHALADFGAVHAGGVPVTFYATLAAEQVGLVAEDWSARIAVLDRAAGRDRCEAVLAQLPALKKIIVRTAPPALPAISTCRGPTSP